MQTKHFDVSFEVKAVNEDGTVEGYGSVFGVKDSYSDVMQKGAFENSIKQHKANKTMPALLWQHDPGQPIGVWTEMSEDDNGLKVKGRLAMDTEKGKEAYALLKMGAISGMSIGYLTNTYQYDEKTDIRTLTDVDLWEVSLVTFPANTKARVTHVKSADDVQTPKDAERRLRESGMSKADATAFVSCVMRMGEQRSDSADSTTEAKAADKLLRLLQSSKEHNHV
jgi:HK97 family phage prohead protease